MFTPDVIIVVLYCCYFFFSSWIVAFVIVVAAADDNDDVGLLVVKKKYSRFFLFSFLYLVCFSAMTMDVSRYWCVENDADDNVVVAIVNVGSGWWRCDVDVKVTC